MKLFALAAATAVDASPWPIRVMTPAPGIVNEQGGYWADQPTHPQAPQWNQQQSHQVHIPYVQKPQCCEGYTWISPTGDYVWMRKSGEHHDKPYYTATDKSGAPLVLFWKFYNSPAPLFAKTGHWYLGSTLGDDKVGVITTSQQSRALRYCPQDYQSKPYTGNMNFECGQGPPQSTQPPPVRQCCDWYQWTPAGTTDNVWMKFYGEKQHGKRIYEGFDGGADKVMFYQPALPGSSAGAWYMGDVVNDPSAPQSANVQGGLMSCPDQSNLGWQGSVGTFSGPGCLSPPKATTCAGEHDKQVLTQSSSGFTQCLIQTVMNNFLDQPLKDFIQKLDQDALQGKNTFDRAQINVLWQFNHAFTAWEDLTRGVWQSDPTFASGGFYKDVCGFNGVSQETRQFKVVTSCDNLCDDIKAIDQSGSSGVNIKAALEEFLFFTLSNFTPST